MGKSKSKKGKQMTTNYTQYGTYSNCHTGSTLIFDKDNVEVYAGGRSHNPKYSGMDLIIDLTGSLKFITWPIPKTWKSAAHLSYPNVLALEITDSQAPWQVDLDFWKAFWADLVDQSKGVIKTETDKYTVLVVCQGGHGRTGVVIGALAAAAGVVDPKKDRDDLVECIRDVYCDEAVETSTQMDYLKNVCGIKTTAKPSNVKPISTGVKVVGTVEPDIPALLKGATGTWCNGNNGTCLLILGHDGDCLSHGTNITWAEYIANGKKLKKGGDGDGKTEGKPTGKSKSYGRFDLMNRFHTWKEIMDMSDSTFRQSFGIGRSAIPAGWE